MKKSASRDTAIEAPQPHEGVRPEVIVDFVFRDGALYVCVANVAGAAAYNVAVKFDKAFRGLGGEREISSLPLFRRLLFLAPHKAIETLVDTGGAYFARREPTRITAQITYRDAARRAYERRISHDLAIYKDITYVVQPATATPVLSVTGVLAATSGRREQTYGGEKR